MQQKIYLTPEQVCERWGNRIAVRTLANWRSAGSGPRFSRLGGRVLYPLSDLVQWEERRTVEYTAQYRR